MKLTRNQEVYFLSNSVAQRTRTVVVIRIGRRWASLSNGLKVDLNQNMFEGKNFLVAWGGEYASPGLIYETEEAYKCTHKLNDRWRALTLALMSVPRNPSPGVTVDDIEAAGRLLRLKGFIDEPSG